MLVKIFNIYYKEIKKNVIETKAISLGVEIMTVEELEDLLK